MNHLNQIEKKSYQHVACLDINIRNSPQPEALYIDYGSNERLVIERKTLVWPPDYAARHRNDHLIAEYLSEGLRELTRAGAYAIRLDLCAVGKPDELIRFSQQIVEIAKSRFAEVQSGKVIGSAEPGRSWRFFREEQELRAFQGAPEKGLVIRWNVPDPFQSGLEIPQGVLDAVSRLFKSCAEKFKGYLDARRVVVVDQYGDIRYNGTWWWTQIFENVPAAPEISEIWCGMFDWVDDSQKGWVFDKLYPVSSPPHLTSQPA